MRKIKIEILTMLAALAMPMGAAQKDNRAEAQLQAAINKETVEGDLKSAIELYKKLAQSSNRAVAANALVRMGQCYDKLGDAEARKAYERVLREFRDQKEAAAQARELLAERSDAAESGAVARQVGGHQGPWTFGSAISRDGRYIAAASWGTGALRIVDLTTGNPVGPDIPISSEGRVNYALISPDGKYVAFRRNDRQLSGLWVIGADGSQPRRVAGGNGVWASPRAWSPDGKQILAHLDSKDKGARAALVSFPEGAAKIISSAVAAEGSFSPDGRHVALVTTKPPAEWQGYGDLVLLDLTTGKESAVVTGKVSQPSWTLDGKRLLLVSDRNGKPDLWAIPMKDGVPSGPMGFVQHNVNGLLGAAPNGEYYYYLRIHVTDLYVADLDPLTGLPASEHRRITTQGDNYGAAWSPDGEYLAGYGARQISGSWKQSLTIYSRTGEARELDLTEPLDFGPGTAFPSPVWFPDSRTLLVHSPDNGKLRRLDVQTARFQSLPEAANVPWYRDSQGRPQRVVLAPDGRSIYYQRRDSEAGETRFLRRALEGGPETEVTRVRAPAVWGFSVSPDGNRLAIAVANPGSGGSIWTAPASGGAAQEFYRVTRGNAPHDPKWGRDGRLFVHLALGDGSVYHLYVFPAEGGEPKSLGLGMGSAVGIRPDGKQIVFHEGQWMNQIWVLKNLFPAAKASR